MGFVQKIVVEGEVMSTCFINPERKYFFVIITIFIFWVFAFLDHRPY